MQAFKQGLELWDLQLRQGGASGYLGIFDHSNTANRTYILPDKDGTFAMLSDIVAGGGVTLDTAQTITGLKSFQQGDNASLGAECITAVANRDFSAAGAWTGTGWSIVSNALAHTAGANAATLPNTALNITPTSGTIYLITMKVITTTLGTLSLSFGGASMGILAGQWVGTVYINKYIAATGNGALTVTPDATWVGSIDDVSIKIITRSLIPSLRLYTTTATTAAEIRAYNNTNIGIGVASHRMNTSGSGNYAFGYYTQAGLTTGVANIAIGTQAQEFLSSGTHNIGIGYYAQNSITSSGSNIGIGGYVQRYLTTGFNNVGIGYQAQQALTVGWNNLGIGTSAQMALTTGKANVALGYQAESTLTTGDYNMGIGVNCLRYLLSGSNNTAIGNNALYTLSTNGENTAIGTDALFNATSSNNTGVGYGVFGDLTSGGYNTGFGALAGDGVTNTTITYCSFFGYNARSTTDGITNSTAIGNGATVTASNQIRLGNSNVTQVVTSGNLIAYAAIIGTQFQSNIPDGTAPITVVSKTLVTDLNADYLDGQHGSYYAPTNQIMYIGTTAVAINRASAALNLNLGGTFAAGVTTLTDSSDLVTTPILATNNYGASASLAEVGIGLGRSASTLFGGVYAAQQAVSNYNYGCLKFKTKTSDALGLETKLTIAANGDATFTGSIYFENGSYGTYIYRNQNYIRLGSVGGYVDIGNGNGAGSTTYLHLFTPQDKFYFSKGADINGSIKVYGTSNYLDSTGIYANKMNTSAVNTWTKAQIVAPISLTAGATSLDANLTNTFILTATSSFTLGDPVNLTAGQTLSIIIIQDATGNRTISYSSGYKFPGGVRPTLSTAPNAIDVISCYYTGSKLLCTMIKDIR